MRRVWRSPPTAPGRSAVRRDPGCSCFHAGAHRRSGLSAPHFTPGGRSRRALRLAQGATTRNGDSMARRSNAAIVAKNARGPQSGQMQPYTLALLCGHRFAFAPQRNRGICTRRCEKCGLECIPCRAWRAILPGSLFARSPSPWTRVSEPADRGPGIRPGEQSGLFRAQRGR